MKKFNCRHFFEMAAQNGNEAEKIAARFYSRNGKMKPCGFEQNENEIDFAPEKHLIQKHGFLENAPSKNKRSLEVQLCKLVDKYLIEL